MRNQRVIVQQLQVVPLKLAGGGRLPHRDHRPRLGGRQLERAQVLDRRVGKRPRLERIHVRVTDRVTRAIPLGDAPADGRLPSAG